MKQSTTTFICLAGGISLVGVAIHIGAIFGGASWFAFFGAPPVVVESARTGTLLAPLGALAIASAMALCAAYAFSATGHVRRLPLLRVALATIAAVCLLRAMLLVPVAVWHPEVRNTFEVVAAIVWGIAGVGFALGFRASRLSQRSPNDNACQSAA